MIRQTSMFLSTTRPGAIATMIVLLCASTLAYATTVDGERYVELSLIVPEGDPAAGREAMVELSCTSCHHVAGDSDLPRPVSSNLGPDLGGWHAAMDPGALASSIVSPSHTVAVDLTAQKDGKLSPMGDFSDAMTVRQLIDLVAYVRTLESE